jgi:hypothetical protein
MTFNELKNSVERAKQRVAEMDPGNFEAFCDWIENMPIEVLFEIIERFKEHKKANMN